GVPRARPRSAARPRPTRPHRAARPPARPWSRSRGRSRAPERARGRPCAQGGRPRRGVQATRRAASHRNGGTHSAAAQHEWNPEDSMRRALSLAFVPIFALLAFPAAAPLVVAAHGAPPQEGATIVGTVRSQASAGLSGAQVYIEKQLLGTTTRD